MQMGRGQAVSYGYIVPCWETSNRNLLDIGHAAVGQQVTNLLLPVDIASTEPFGRVMFVLTDPNSLLLSGNILKRTNEH